MKRNTNARIFAVSFYTTLCVLVLAIGILEVDYYSRQTGFGDDQTLIHALTGWDLHLKPDCS